MLEFHSLMVTGVEPTAQDAACLSLRIPPALRDAFAFDAGQYVTVRRVIEEREERRSYSIVCAPGGEELKLGIRRQPGGRMSQVLAQLRPGDWLEVGTPMGRFRTAVDPARAQSYVAFAAGSGITPILCLVTDLLQREPLSRVTLIYGNQNASRSMFLEETLALKNRHLRRFAVHFVMSREPQQAELLNGRIDAPKVRDLARHFAEIGAADEYFVCGPGDMVEAVRGVLSELNGRAPIRFERFAGGAPRSAPAPATLAQAPAAGAESSGEHAPLARIAVVMDGRRRSFTMRASDASVLEAAERAGLQLPFSCRAGICATCRTQITEGAAVMTHNIGLEPWEIERGFVLCCQARPTTATLELSYDQK